MVIGGIQAAAISRQARQDVLQRRQARVLALHATGMTRREIGNRLGCGERTVYRDLCEIQDARIEIDDILAARLLDGDDLHDTVTAMHDADLADIVSNPDAPIEELRYKPIGQWPAVWRRGLAGKVRITPVAVADGERTSGGDPVMYKIEVERESLLKIIELAGRLKPVDAFVAQKAGDTNVVVITAEQQRGDRLKRAKARIVNVSATSIEDGPAGVDALRALPQAQGDEK